MHLPLLLEMTVEAMPDRVAIGGSAQGLTFSVLSQRAHRAAQIFASAPGRHVVLIDVNSDAVPISLFGAAIAGRAFVPVNYRLTDHQLRAVVERTAPATVVVGPDIAPRVDGIAGLHVIDRVSLLAQCDDDAGVDPAALADVDPDSIAVLLFTSGTTGEPKAAVLRHVNLASYILSTVELAGAGEDEAALVSVPPYHIAGVSAILSSTYGGRRLVYLESFDPAGWVDAVDRERITHAMVVPTMLGRVLDEMEQRGTSLPTLRSLSYGGGPMPLPVIERAMRLLPHVSFVNTYGLTETASTISVLAPEDHRIAAASVDPAIRRRLSSVGRPLPSIELSIRDSDGRPVPVGQPGQIWVSGPQVSGEYLGRPAPEGGWFDTRDSGELDADGFLYLHGRLDDVIVRGGENLSPGEIEAVLVEHPAVYQAAVVGIPDQEWGERVVAAVIAEPGRQIEEGELREFVRSRLRSTRTPERIRIREELPTNETGKLLRRVLHDELTTIFGQ